MTTGRAIAELEAMGFRPIHPDSWSPGAVVSVSCEPSGLANDRVGGDYYREGGDYGYPGTFDDFGTATALVKWADRNGLYWEWHNAGVTSAWPA